MNIIVRERRKINPVSLNRNPNSVLPDILLVSPICLPDKNKSANDGTARDEARHGEDSVGLLKRYSR